MMTAPPFLNFTGFAGSAFSSIPITCFIEIPRKINGLRGFFLPQKVVSSGIM